MSAERKPCPFCGDATDAGLIKAGTRRWAIECANCGARSLDALTKNDAITSWNRRTAPRDSAPVSQPVTDEEARKFEAFLNRPVAGQGYSIRVRKALEDFLARRTAGGTK